MINQICKQQIKIDEACGNLYHFKRIPFGVTNGVAVFQRTIDNIIKGENVPASFAYLDNVTVCGNSLTELEANVKLFKDASRNTDSHSMTQKVCLELKRLMSPVSVSQKEKYALTPLGLTLYAKWNLPTL